jgi:tryptophan-rich sensory protein
MQSISKTVCQLIVWLSCSFSIFPIASRLLAQDDNAPTVGIKMPWIEWYNSLAKPNWTPPPATIGMIWQILYPVILISFGFVFVQALRSKVNWWIALPFAIILVANLIFTPTQFGLRNLPLAALDILVVWATIIWCMVAVWQHSKWVSLAQVPYFIWVSLATVLQMSITWMNWGRAISRRDY